MKSYVIRSSDRKRVAEFAKKQTEEMKALEEQREEALKVEKYDEAAVELHNMYNSYIKAGFTEEQAWKLTEIVFANSTKKGIF